MSDRIDNCTLYCQYILLFLLMISCQVDSIPTEENIIYLETPSKEQKIFDQVLTLRDSFSFDFGEDTNRVVPGFFRLRMNSKEEILVVNNGKIARFTNKGKFISDFAGEGKGPGEFIFLIDFNIASNSQVSNIGKKIGCKAPLNAKK